MVCDIEFFRFRCKINDGHIPCRYIFMRSKSELDLSINLYLNVYTLAGNAKTCN